MITRSIWRAAAAQLAQRVFPTMVRAFIVALRPTIAILIASLIASLGVMREARADTLADAIALAYQTNPTLQAARAQLRAIDESYVQARGGYRPQVGVSIEGDYANNTSTYGVGVPDAAASISVTQPLYTGGLVSAEVRAAMADILSSRQKLRQVEADVLQSVIQSYVDVRRDQQAFSIADENVDVLTHQLEETNARLAAGEVTRTDVALAEARLAAARAQRTSAQAQLSVSRSNYTALVGQNPGELAAEPELPGLPATIEQAFDAASRTSPVILGADYTEQAAAARVSVAKSADRPTVSLRAQFGADGYYANDPLLAVHSGLYQRNITASVVLTQPLFTGGLNASHIRQALDIDNAQLIDIEAAQRQTIQAISQAWARLSASRANVTAEVEQVRADGVAYEGTHEEQQAGLRTTIEVLNAEQELRNAQLALIGARHDEYVAGASLLNAMGMLEAALLAPETPRYSPEAALNRVKRVGAVPWEGLVAGVDSIGEPSIKMPVPVHLDSVGVTSAAQPSAGAQVLP